MFCNLLRILPSCFECILNQFANMFCNWVVFESSSCVPRTIGWTDVLWEVRPHCGSTGWWCGSTAHRMIRFLDGGWRKTERLHFGPEFSLRIGWTALLERFNRDHRINRKLVGGRSDLVPTASFIAVGGESDEPGFGCRLYRFPWFRQNLLLNG